MPQRRMALAFATGLVLLALTRSAVAAPQLSDTPPDPNLPTAAGGDWHDRDNFLGQISMSYVQDSFHDRVDGFSGNLHINMVDVTLPGHGGLDLVVQRYYSSAIWNRVEGGVYTKHAASSDPMDHLGGSGWQLHMGKIIKPTSVNEPYLLIMPDGSTHPLYSTGSAWISRERWTLSWVGSPGRYDLTLTDGTVYSFDPYHAYTDYHNQLTYQCTRISKPGVTGSSIQIQYDASSHLLTGITDTYDRTVQLQYVSGGTRLSSMTVKSGSDILQTWQYTYVYQGVLVQESGYGRSVYALTAVQPPVGNSWAFAYNPGSTAYGNGTYALQKVTMPTGGSISYTYNPVTFNTGTQTCNVLFCVVASRQLRDRDNSSLGTWSYAYAGSPYPGSDGATTTVTVKNPQNSTLLTDVSVFNGWSSWQAFDSNMWKVGLPQQRTVTTYGISPNQTEVETYSWEQGDWLSAYVDHTTNWLACGSYRTATTQTYFIKPVSRARTVTRDGVAYTTTTSNLDRYGNPQAVTEAVNGSQKRATQLTYWTYPSLNILVGKVATRTASPGARECVAYDTYGRRIKTILNPVSLTACTRGSESLETGFTYDSSTGDLTKETKVNYGGYNSETQYLSYAYGQPRQVQVTGTNISIDRTVNASGTIATSTDGRGNVSAYRTSYTYDGLNRLTGIQPPGSGSLPTTFTYENNWSQVTVARGNHNLVYSFDGLGRLTEREDQQTTHTVTNAYNALGVRTQQQLLYGTMPVDTSVFDAVGRLTSLTHYGDGSAASYTYYGTSGTGPKVYVEDETGSRTTLEYEAFGDPGDTRLKRVTDAAGNLTSYDYNTYNLVSSITAPLSKGNRSFTYYPNLLLQTETHPESGTTTHTYDGLGNRTGRAQAGGVSETYGYDRANRLVQRTFTGSNVTFSWDGASQRTQMSSSDGTFDYAYDGNKNLLSKQSFIPGAGTFTETFTYDSTDRLDVATYPGGRKVKHTYDNRDWLTGVKSLSGGNDYASSITRHVNGVVDQILLGNGARTHFDLDPRYRVDGISTSASSGSLLGLSFTYDRSGDLKYWDDTLNNTNDRSFTYDSLHRLTTASAPGLWGSVTFDYDALGNRSRRIQGSRLTDYTYDGNNRLTRATTGSPYESYSYNLRGDLTQAVIPQANITSLSPDNAQVRPSGGSTIVTVTINGSGFAPTSLVTFNGVPKPTTFVTSSTLRMELTYDDLKTARIYPVNVTSPAGRGSKSAMGAGATAPFVVHFADVPPGHWAYASVNLAAHNGITAGCGNGNFCPNDSVSRADMAIFLLTAKHGAGYVPPACTGVFRDVQCPLGYAVKHIEQLNREAIVGECANKASFCPASPTLKSTMAVFLLSLREPSGYTPPACTNVFADVHCVKTDWAAWIVELYRRGIDLGCSAGQYCPDSSVSRALMAQMIARTWGFQMPFQTPSAGSDTYSYTFNTAHQLTNVLTPSGSVSFTYDGDGQRIKKTSASGTIVYVRDAGDQVIAEYNGSGVLLAEYVYADGQRLCRVSKDAQNVERRLYYHADFLGTPLAETNESGQVVAKAEYHPFGEEAEAGSATDPHKFTGKELDSEFGLYYSGARYYDAHLGRFISVDPVGGNSTDPQTWNRYAYARNNPLKYVDPDGRELRTAAQETVNAIAGSAASRVVIRNGVVDTAGLTSADVSGNEGAALLNQLATSKSVYTYTEGPVKDGVQNLDNRPDWRYGKGKKPENLPPAGVDDAVSIDPGVRYVDNATGTKAVSLPATAFHELAEAYAKVDKGMPYVPKGGGAGAHEDARQRERTLLGQRPGFTAFPAGEMLKKDKP